MAQVTRTIGLSLGADLCWPICYEEILKRDKLSLDVFWIKDKSLTDTDSLPSPDIRLQLFSAATARRT